MPPSTASAPSTWAIPAGSPNRTNPADAPTSGSRLRNAPATSGATRAWPYASSVNGRSVPPTMSPATASTGPTAVGAATGPSKTSANGSATSPPAANCTAVTAIGSRPASSRG